MDDSKNRDPDLQGNKEIFMDTDRNVGVKKEVSGTIKEALGKAVGDGKLETEDKMEKVVGKIQNSIGGAMDAIKTV